MTKLKHAAGATLRPGPIPNPSSQILGIFVNPSPKKGTSMSKKSRKARRRNGKRPVAVAPKATHAQMVALAKQAGKIAASTLAADLKKSAKRNRRVRNVAAAFESPILAARPEVGSSGSRGYAAARGATTSATAAPSARALQRAMRGGAVGGGFGRRGSRMTPGVYSSGEQKRDELLSIQEQLDLLTEMKAAAGKGSREEAVIEDEIDALKEGLNISELALLESAALQGVRSKEVERRLKQAKRAYQRAKPLKAISDKLRGHAIAAIQMAANDGDDAGKLLVSVFGENFTPLTDKQLDEIAADHGLTVDTNSTYNTLAPYLLSVRPDILQAAIEMLETEFADFPVLGATPEERKWTNARRKILARLQAAQHGRIQNPKRGKKRRRNMEIDPTFMIRSRNPKRGKKRRRNMADMGYQVRSSNPRKRRKGRKGNPLDMGYQVRSPNPRKRRKARRRNPSLSDFQRVLQGGTDGLLALLKQIAWGSSGYLLSGLAEAALSGDVVTQLNVTQYLPDSLGKGKPMIASALAAALSGGAVWGLGKAGVSLVSDNAPGLYIGIGLRLIRNLLDHATRGNASLQSIRNLADLPQLGAYGCGAWNPGMNGYYNFMPVMGGYYNYQPALSGYYNYQPALSGAPVGSELSGPPVKNPFGEPF